MPIAARRARADVGAHGRVFASQVNACPRPANGNTLMGGGRTTTWDSQNRLVQCAYNGTTTTNTYACDGLRHRSVVGTNTSDYVLDSSLFVRELPNGTVKRGTW